MIQRYHKSYLPPLDLKFYLCYTLIKFLILFFHSMIDIENKKESKKGAKV